MSPVLHVALRNEIRAFDFEARDFEPLREALPSLEIAMHARPGDLREVLPEAELIASWGFRPEWYAQAPKLRLVSTPAAGHDWVAEDPEGRVPARFSTFHGPLIAESMLAMMGHFNRRHPAMLANQERRGWDRNLQFPGRLLRNQRALLVGYGQIGRHCARLLRALGMEVAGCQRSVASGVDPESGARYCRPEDLPDELAGADHVVMLLPGGDATRDFMDAGRLAAMKPGAHLYNFGRGTTVSEPALLEALDAGRLGGAGLDVTAVEPLPPESPLWRHPRVFVMPHSSCIYEEYRGLYVEELKQILRQLGAR